MTNQTNSTANMGAAPQAEVRDDELRVVGHVFDLGASRAEIQWLVPDPWTHRPLYLCKN
jgi:hypothetical protein